MNPLEIPDKSEENIELYTQQLVRVFEEMIPDAKLSNYMRAILTPCIATLLHYGSTDLTHLQQFMSKSHSHKWIEIGKTSRNKIHQLFFRQEFQNRIYDITKGSIYTKIQSLLNSSVFAHMTSGRSTIYLERYIRQGKIVLFNLSKGRLGEEVSETLGRFIIAQVKRIALSRAKLPPHLRKPIYLVIDEADTFIKGDSLNIILKETRKYGLHLVLCTQNLVT